jgi:Fe(II)/alpha-ketoglutarate-dependent arginine beta-hydroxylase
VKIILDEGEKGQILDLLDHAAARFQSAEQSEFLAEATVLAHELPRRVRGALNEFRLREPDTALCTISGYPIDEDKIGCTPAHWKERQRCCKPVREEMLLVLLGSLLGDVIAWATQQDGAVVHDIVPIKAHENEQLGSGSKEELTWHTEDAFHPFRGDYLGMMCLRNTDQVPTTFATIDTSELDARTLGLLFEPHYTIRPDNSHLSKHRMSPAGNGHAAAHERIDEMVARPEKIPLFYGSPEAPYFRLDPYFMDPPEDPAAREALEKVIHLVDSRLENLLLGAGEICFIDNFKAVHGRRPFKPRYDGMDRWLKRINITRDLRRSRTARSTPEARALT